MRKLKVVVYEFYGDKKLNNGYGYSSSAKFDIERIYNHDFDFEYFCGFLTSEDIIKFIDTCRNADILITTSWTYSSAFALRDNLCHDPDFVSDEFIGLTEEKIDHLKWKMKWPKKDKQGFEKMLEIVKQIRNSNPNLKIFTYWEYPFRPTEHRKFHRFAHPLKDSNDIVLSNAVRSVRLAG